MYAVRSCDILGAAKKIELDVSVVNMAILDQTWDSPNMRASFTRVYFPIEGEGSVTVGGETWTIVPGKIYVIPSGIDVSCRCPRMLKKIYAHLNLRNAYGGDLLGGHASVIVLDDTDGITAKMETLCERSDVSAVMELRSILWSLLMRAVDRTPVAVLKIKSLSENTERAVEYIDRNLSAGLTIGAIADGIFVSRQLLQRQFKEDIGKTVGRYIDDRIMEKAERYLLDPSVSIKEISDRLGFCDQFYFSRRFTEIHGVSPLRFRKMNNA